MSMVHELMMRKKIPAIYKVLDWIRGDGIGTYIDTEIQNNDNNSLFFKFMVIDDIKTTLCGGYSSSSNGYYSNSVTIRTTNQARILKTNAKLDISTTVGTHELKITPNNVVYDGQTLNWSSDSGNTQVSNIYLFRSKYSSTVNYGKVNICEFMLWDSNNSLVRNMIPVRRTTDNVVGMYDTVSKTFFTNAGTGTFIGSDE